MFGIRIESPNSSNMFGAIQSALLFARQVTFATCSVMSPSSLGIGVASFSILIVAVQPQTRLTETE